ncbi:MAG: hypothetical protein KJ574_01765 [Nanoarchaeota archaeon]|nr:hypothetical protein [Nanoarchaeota archaeon]
MEREILKHYKQDSDGKYLLEFAIKELDDFYDPLDPDSLHERDLNPAIVDRVLQEIIIFPHDAELRFLFHLPKKWKKHNVEKHLENAVRHTFKYNYLDVNIHLHRRMRKGKKIFVAASVIFIGLVSTAKIIESMAADSFAWIVIAEGLYIGGWVSLWRPIETLLYDWLPLKEEKKRYARLLHMDIKFVYE